MSGGKRSAEQKELKQDVSNTSFVKEQILVSAKYQHRRDLLNALLQDGESYSLETIDKKIEDYMKGPVR